MANLADAISQSFADRYDPQKQAVSKIMTAEARKIDTELPTTKLIAGMDIRKELTTAREAKAPDQDWIDFLTDLLKELKAV